MTNEIIRIKREEKKLSQKALSNLIGVSQQHINRYEKGYPIPLDKVLLLSKALGIDKWDLLPKEFRDAEPPHENIVALDVLDVTACCGNGKENFTENVIGKHMMSLPALREMTNAAPENIKIIKAIGDSMQPTIQPGDIVWVDVSFKSPASDGLYLLCVGQDLMIKRIQVNPFDNSALIKSDNPQYSSFPKGNYQEIRVIGKVIYHMKKTS